MLAIGHHVGNNYWLVLGPIIIALAILTWLVLTRIAARRRARPERTRGSMPDRGPVQGGIIEGDPGQRNRRDVVQPEEYEHRGHE
ncbi:hypothetical protein [Actinomadura oligospora]|uniref:hypothetical protein n=1 Tax=Actinomadura oligospora TaxID=111804 RepID=UPI000478B482|nr:hypothetical protein [Actinomadura oligospora]